MISKKKRQQGTVVKRRDVNDLLNSLDLYGTVNLPAAEVYSDNFLSNSEGFLDEVYQRGWMGETPEEYDVRRRNQLDYARRKYMGELSPSESFIEDYYNQYGSLTGQTAEPFYPMNYISAAGDVEALAASAGQLAEGDYLEGILSGSLALGSIFLPSTVQVKSTRGGSGVFEKMIDKDGNINRNSVLSIANKEGVNKGEAAVLNKVAESMPDKVPYTQFKQAVSDELAFVTSQTKRHAGYGVGNVYDRLFGTPFESGVVDDFDANRLLSGYSEYLGHLDIIRNRGSFDKMFDKVKVKKEILQGSASDPFASSYQITRSDDIMGMFDWYEMDHPYHLGRTTINTIAGEQLRRQGFSKDLLREDPRKAMDIVMETMADVNTGDKIYPKTGLTVDNAPTRKLVYRYSNITDDIDNVIDGAMTVDEFYDKYRFDLLEEEDGVAKLNFFYDTVEKAQVEKISIQAIKDQYRPSPTAMNAIDRAIAEMDAAGFGGVRSETHLLSNPAGNYPVSDVHFQENPTAHIRTFESHTRPESLFISELQSDALQSFKTSKYIDLGLELGKKKEATTSDMYDYLQKAIDFVDNEVADSTPAHSKVREGAVNFFKAFMSKYKGKNIDAMRRDAAVMSQAVSVELLNARSYQRIFLEEVDRMADFFLNNSSRDISLDWSDFYDIPDQAIPKAAQKSQYKRLVQESTRIAAEKGKTKVLFPTGNTVYKIEGWGAIPSDQATNMMKPYDRLNKDIKKTLGVDAKKVEIQGDTWWEVEIPESYLKGEQEITAFGQGGRMRILKRKEC